MVAQGYVYHATQTYLLQKYAPPSGYGTAPKSSGASRFLASAQAPARTRVVDEWADIGRRVWELRDEAAVYARRSNAALDSPCDAELHGNKSEAARLSAEGKRFEAMMFY